MSDKTCGECAADKKQMTSFEVASGMVEEYVASFCFVVERGVFIDDPACEHFKPKED